SLDDCEPASIHGDLKPDHIFLSGDRVTFIDFDRAALADPLLDPAQLAAYIKRIGLDSGPILLEEYFRLVPEAWKQRFHMHYAGELLIVAAVVFRRQEKNWPGKITKIIEAAEHEVSLGRRPE